jgi:hypothetical protein
MNTKMIMLLLVIYIVILDDFEKVKNLNFKTN